MTIVDIFDAAREGSYNNFLHLFNGNVNDINTLSDVNLLCCAVSESENSDAERLKIIKFLLEKGIDINYTTKKDKRNALHFFYAENYRPSISFENEVTKLLIDYGIDVNARDRYGAIPLSYAIANNKLTTKENEEMYRMLLDAGSDYNSKDNFGNSCLDYAKEFSWRNDFLELIEERLK